MTAFVHFSCILLSSCTISFILVLSLLLGSDNQNIVSAFVYMHASCATKNAVPLFVDMIFFLFPTYSLISTRHFSVFLSVSIMFFFGSVSSVMSMIIFNENAVESTHTHTQEFKSDR